MAQPAQEIRFYESDGTRCHITPGPNQMHQLVSEAEARQLAKHPPALWAWDPNQQRIRPAEPAIARFYPQAGHGAWPDLACGPTQAQQPTAVSARFGVPGRTYQGSHANAADFTVLSVQTDSDGGIDRRVTVFNHDGGSGHPVSHANVLDGRRQPEIAPFFEQPGSVPQRPSWATTLEQDAPRQDRRLAAAFPEPLTAAALRSASSRASTLTTTTPTLEPLDRVPVRRHSS